MWFAPSVTVSSLDRTGWMVTATVLAIMTFGSLKLILSGARTSGARPGR